MKLQKSILFILVFSASVFLPNGVWSQIPAEYSPLLHYDGGTNKISAISTHNGEQEGEETALYHWTDGQVEINGVQCWRIFSSPEGFYTTTEGNYSICYTALVDNELRLYMDEDFEPDGQYRTTYYPYCILWKYDIEEGSQWSQTCSTIVESLPGSAYSFYSTGSASSTTTIHNYENISTVYGDYNNALKIEETQTWDSDYGAYSTSSTGWLAPELGRVKTDYGEGWVDHYNQEYSSSTAPTEPATSPPAAPSISYSTAGTNLSVFWSSVFNATGYTLLYAPFPFTGLESIVSFDMANQTSLSIDLWEGASFFIAVQAYNDQGSSDYSNIELFTISP